MMVKIDDGYSKKKKLLWERGRGRMRQESKARPRLSTWLFLPNQRILSLRDGVDAHYTIDQCDITIMGPYS